MFTNEDVTTGTIQDNDDNFTFEITSVTDDGWVNCSDGMISWQLPVSEVVDNLNNHWEYAQDYSDDDFPMSLEYNDDAYDYSGDIDSY